MRGLDETSVLLIKSASAAVFGIILLLLIVVTKHYWQAGWQLARYDFLFLAALAVQVLLLVTRLETWEEAKVIFLFHIVGTIMELFKTHAGSWVYPEANFFRIEEVPLFSGFMYSSVGSFIARATRLFNLKYENYPPLWLTFLLCGLVYVNFFAHHFTYDIRLFLFAFAAVLFFKTSVYFTIKNKERKLPLLAVFVIVAFLIWLAENIATYGGAWIYPYQKTWQMVKFSKIGAWFLLMLISFVLVTLIHRPDKQIEKS